MTVSVFLIQTRSVVSNQYRVDNSITTSSGISTKVFVKKESNYTYDRVATLDDMLNVPDAPDPHYGYYRDDIFYMDFVDVSTAEYFAQGVKRRLDLLVSDYDEASNHFQGSSGENIHS
jgi:hypothetical protein